MRQYELTYLISDNVPESELNKVTGRVGGYVADLGGKTLKEEIWGRRKLAYPINKQDFATYITINFDLPANKAIEFERNIKLTSKIIRHLMIVKDFGEEKLTLTKEDIAATEEIKEVIGGEKSFEAVEGETEESKDLMAVRESEIEKEEAAVEDKLEKIAPVEIVKEEKVENKVEEVEKKKSETKETKKVKKEAKVVEVPEKEEKSAPEKNVKKKAKPVKTEENEADRLSKLDKELDDILGDDL